MKKALIVIVSKRQALDKQATDCLAAAAAQDYPNYSILVSMADWELSTDEERNKRLNIVKNSNKTKAIALASDADYFLLLDTDVVMPKNALSELMLQLEQPRYDAKQFEQITKLFPGQSEQKQKHIIGAWFKITPNLYNCGRWVADNTFYQLQAVENSVVKVDKIDFGCMLVSREAFEKLEFKMGGTVIFNHDISSCSCMMYALDAQNAGYELWMNGNVICRHKDLA